VREEGSWCAAREKGEEFFFISLFLVRVLGVVGTRNEEATATYIIEQIHL